MKKPKKQQQQAPTKATQDEQEKQIIQRATKSDPQATEKALDASTALSTDPTVVTEGEGKKKRRRKHKSGVTGDGADAETTTAMELDA
jgi:U3 small nucleolar RNA-associated protein 23